MIHRLVAETYIINKDNKPCVCHKDDNPENNNADNLFWGTHQENMQDAARKGKFKNKRSKKILERMGKIKDLRSNGMKLKDIGEVFGIKEARVSQILKEINSL